jgi:WD repeat-containing protein 19
MAGFSLGYVVVISTKPHEIGREQFCARFHNNELGDLVYSPETGFLASCGDGAVKLIEMDDWRVRRSDVMPCHACQ